LETAQKEEGGRMEAKEITLEEIVVKIWGMAQASIEQGNPPYEDNVVRQATLEWALGELKKKAKI